VHDPNFFIKAAFPSENSKVICDGIVMQNLMQVDGQQHKIVKESNYLSFIDRKTPSAKSPEQTDTAGFFYFTCETSNNTAVDVVNQRHRISASEQSTADLNELEDLLSSS